MAYLSAAATISPGSGRPRDRPGGGFRRQAAGRDRPYDWGYFKTKDEPNDDSNGFSNKGWHGLANGERNCGRYRQRPRLRQRLRQTERYR
jgi:hypothetical protein